MLFSSKVRETAKPYGLTVQATRDVAAFATAASGAKLAIVDLRLDDALEAVSSLSTATAASGLDPKPDLRIVGFIDHERTDVMDAARARGCHEVMAKGQFANTLPRLFAALTAPKPPPP
jgi:hypothetical protein